MTQAIQDLMPQLQRLSSEERAEIAHLLLQSLESEDDDPAAVKAAWKAELYRRVEEINSGKATLIPHEEALARLRKKLQ